MLHVNLSVTCPVLFLFLFLTWWISFLLLQAQVCKWQNDDEYGQKRNCIHLLEFPLLCFWYMMFQNKKRWGKQSRKRETIPLNFLVNLGSYHKVLSDSSFCPLRAAWYDKSLVVESTLLARGLKTLPFPSTQ